MSIAEIVLTIIAVIIFTWDGFLRFNWGDKLKSWRRGRLVFSARGVITKVGELDGKIRRSDFSPDIVIGIAGGKYVGGGIVGNFLASRRFRDCPALHLELPRNDKGDPIWSLCDKIIRTHLTDENIERWNNYLVVDDWINTGKTIKGVVERLGRVLREKKENFYIWGATIVLNPNSYQEIGDELRNRTFYCIKSDKELDLPWLV